MTRIVKDKNSDRLLAICPNGSIGAGHFAVDPAGNLVALSPSSPLKAGWKWATAEDVKAADAAEAKRNPQPAA